MQNKYCLPIIRPTTAEVMQTIKKHRHDFANFEVWLDYLADLDDTFVNQLAESLGDKLVIVFRRQNLEPMTIPLARRLEILSQLADTAVRVDLDIKSQLEEFAYITDNNLQLTTIASYHNYAETPADDILQHVIELMATHKPTIFKIATMCKSPEDAVRLLALLLTLRNQGKQCIILGMGEHGVATRIFGTLWGNELTFVPESQAHASAPGQLTRQQLDTITTILKGNQ